MLTHQEVRSDARLGLLLCAEYNSSAAACGGVGSTHLHSDAVFIKFVACQLQRQRQRHDAWILPCSDR